MDRIFASTITALLLCVTLIEVGDRYNHSQEQMKLYEYECEGELTQEELDAEPTNHDMTEV